MSDGIAAAGDIAAIGIAGAYGTAIATTMAAIPTTPGRASASTSEAAATTITVATGTRPKRHFTVIPKTGMTGRFVG
jgi:hypothetical protein